MLSTLLKTKTVSALAGVLVFLSISTNTHAIDIENGEFIHNENCLSCHQPSLYVSDESSISSLKSLKSRVQYCEISNDLTWFEEEVDDVVEYLNVNFYRFGLK